MDINGIKWLDFTITYRKIKPFTIIITGGPGGLPPSKNNQKVAVISLLGVRRGYPVPLVIIAEGPGGVTPSIQEFPPPSKKTPVRNPKCRA